uniref:rRNA biogenesis protein RRP36 n=1 Tax=Trypanosoma vivax (strain Y486) TaxID=1055687 RepID=G0U2M0_TRYVY|nr:conserved hypothetical protein [Trypanosoma vivax Y486]
MSDAHSDGPPPERSAREKPRRWGNVPMVRHRRSIDPRFSDFYGTVDRKQFENNYKFLREWEAAEEVQRRERIHLLKRAVHRYEREERGSSDECTEDDEDGVEDEVAALMLRPLDDLRRELRELERELQVHVSRVKGRQAQSRRDALRKQIIKREAAAVRDGKKQRAFIPKRSQLKRELLSETFERLERKGGMAAVDKYVERKAKKHR